MFLSLWAGVAGAATADTLFMKDGTKRIGTIESQDTASTHIRTTTDLLVISADDIVRTGREKPRDELIPHISFYLNGGFAFPSQFDFSTSGGFRVGARYMLTKMFGLNASFTYASWQFSYDTILAFKGAVSAPQTFTITAASPRVGAIVVTPLGAKTRLLIGLDVGETFFSAVNTVETSPSAQTSFSYAFRFDLRMSLTDHVGLMVGAQFENFSTTFVNMEHHDLTTGGTRRIGDIVVSAGIDYGF